MNEESDFADSTMPPDMEPEVPQEIAEAARLFPSYEILRLLGRGGMGAVFQGRQIGLNRLVAIKVLAIEISANDDFAERFRQEAQAMARLNHPNIVSVYDSGQTAEGHLFFVMEYVDGANLSDIIREVGLNADQALSVVEQICAALGYAHGKGVVHRDVKPANVMIDQESNVKVADFGLARLMDQNGEPLDGMPGGLVFGTPDYMAPEQMRAMDVDHRADIYSLGVMTYEMLCGEVPRGAFLPPSQRTGCDARIDHIVIKAMQQSAELRYQSTAKMEADVTAARAPRPLPPPTALRPLGPIEPQYPVRPTMAPGPVRPRAHAPMPMPAPQGSSLAGWVWVGLAVCGAVGSLLYYAPWKTPVVSDAATPAPAAVVEPAPAATPAPAPATPVPAAPVAVVPETPPPPVEPAATPVPKPLSDMEKWLADIDAQQQDVFQKQATKPYEAGVADLRARYLAALDAGLARTSAAGQLDQALVWRNEREDFAKAQSLVTDDAIASPEIRALRADYRQRLAPIEQERAVRARALYANYDGILVKYITLLTQKQRLDDALLLKTKREELAKAWGIENQPPVAQQPAAQPKAIPPAPGSNARGTVSLLDLTPSKEPKIGFGSLKQGGERYLGDAVVVNGERCNQWLGAHAPSRVVYAIPFGVKTFSAVGVRPDNQSIPGSWRYMVRIDGNQVFRSKPLNEYRDFQVPIEVAVPMGAKTIELIVDELENFRNDHAVWALPVFKK